MIGEKIFWQIIFVSTSVPWVLICLKLQSGHLVKLRAKNECCRVFYNQRCKPWIVSTTAQAPKMSMFATFWITNDPIARDIGESTKYIPAT